MNLTSDEIDLGSSNQCKERNCLNVARMEGFCIFIPYLGI